MTAPESGDARGAGVAPGGPVRRSYGSSASRRGLRGNVLGWSLVGGGLGLMLGLYLWNQGTVGLGQVAAIAAGAWAATYFLPLLVLAGAERTAGALYGRSGASTPRRSEYSQAETYLVRGEYEAATTAFEAAVSADPSDPLPYLHLARLQRDRLKDYRASASWFKRCMAEADMSSGQRLLALREFVELYETRIGQPEKAAPFLARLASDRPDDADGQWAAQALSDIKRQMRGESDPDTGPE